MGNISDGYGLYLSPHFGAAVEIDIKFNGIIAIRFYSMDARAYWLLAGCIRRGLGKGIILHLNNDETYARLDRCRFLEPAEFSKAVELSGNLLREYKLGF